MGKLSTYVSAIHNQASPAVISSQHVEKTCWQDQGFDVSKEVTVYCFDNGVVVRRTIEQDTFPSELACAECWIIYEVISSGSSGLDIDPQRKVFESTCRESFWLAWHTA